MADPAKQLRLDVISHFADAIAIVGGERNDNHFFPVLMEEKDRSAEVNTNRLAIHSRRGETPPIERFLHCAFEGIVVADQRMGCFDGSVLSDIAVELHR